MGGLFIYAIHICDDRRLAVTVLSVKTVLTVLTGGLFTGCLFIDNQLSKH